MYLKLDIFLRAALMKYEYQYALSFPHPLQKRGIDVSSFRTVCKCLFKTTFLKWKSVKSLNFNCWTSILLFFFPFRRMVLNACILRTCHSPGRLCVIYVCRFLLTLVFSWQLRKCFGLDIPNDLFYSFGREHLVLPSPEHASSPESTVTSSGEWAWRRWEDRGRWFEASCSAACWGVCKWQEYRQILFCMVSVLFLPVGRCWIRKFAYGFRWPWLQITLRDPAESKVSIYHDGDPR